ncbi:TPA: hypothetical protein DIT45_00970 [Candidatus Acetothermia bacterium]|nr:hypothetical protein [Candidatus Acetothermia bacterium]
MTEEMEGINSPYRNSKLFSHDFLEERLPNLPEWQIPKDELQRAREKLQSLFQRALPATSEAALEEELIRPILSEVLGFSYLVQLSTAVFKMHRQPNYALFLTEDEKQVAKALDGEKELVVIDEFAPMEIFSPAFVPAVEEALASNKGLIISTHAHASSIASAASSPSTVSRWETVIN